MVHHQRRRVPRQQHHEWRIGQHDVEAVLLLNIADVLGQRIRVDYAWCLDAVQDHVHNADNVREGLLLLSVKSFLLKRAYIFG